MSSGKASEAPPPMPPDEKIAIMPPVKKRPRWARRWLPRLLIACALPVIAYFVFFRGGDAPQSGPAYQVKRGTLKLTVTEGGGIDALESQEIKSEVLGQTKILSIVEEGSTVTQHDVDSGKILVELDSTDLIEKQTAQELDYQNARAAFTKAKEDYEITQNQNQSDITAAEIAVKFAASDMERYLSYSVYQDVMKQVTIKDDVPMELPGPDKAENLPPASDKKDEAAAPAEDNTSTRIQIDFNKYVDAAALADGAAGQQLRTLEDAFVLAKKQLGLSQTLFEGTQRLAAREFVTKNDLENERLNVEKNEIALKSAETSKELFIKYEFPKMAEKLLSDYVEFVRKLQRAKKLALSKLAQAEATLKATEAAFTLQSQKRKTIQEQIDKCRIKAKRPGLVVYAGGEDWRGDDRIEEGATVRERQKIITIPDMTQMAAKIKVHESSIKNVEKGQKATITVESYPDEVLTGEVVKVGVLPDLQNRWMNPDVKVYAVDISIDRQYPWLKPGMSTEVEIHVRDLDNVLFVPVQSVTMNNGERVCYVAGADEPERRVIETGEFNNEYIEVKGGLNEGEAVLLHPPTPVENADNGNADSGDANKQGDDKTRAGTEKDKADKDKPVEKADAKKPEAPVVAK